jgi:hypothetical protein
MDEHLVEGPDQTGHNTAEYSPVNFFLADGAAVEERPEDNLIFIGRFGRICLYPPYFKPFILVIQTKNDVRIADVDG